MTRVWEYSKTTGTELLVILALADRADDDGYCFPGVAYIAHKARVTDRRVQQILRKLEEMGEINTDMRCGRHNANLYRVVVGLEMVKPVSPIEHRNGEIQSTEMVKSRVEMVKSRVEMVKSRVEMVKSGAQKVKPISPNPSIDPSIDTPMDPSKRSARAAPLYQGFEADVWAGVTGQSAIPGDQDGKERVLEKLNALARKHTTVPELIAYCQTYFTDWIGRKTKDGRRYSRTNPGWLDNALAGELPDKPPPKNGSPPRDYVAGEYADYVEH
jgi:hypothetical protein